MLKLLYVLVICLISIHCVSSDVNVFNKIKGAIKNPFKAAKDVVNNPTQVMKDLNPLDSLKEIIPKMTQFFNNIPIINSESMKPDELVAKIDLKAGFDVIKQTAAFVSDIKSRLDVKKIPVVLTMVTKMPECLNMVSKLDFQVIPSIPKFKPLSIVLCLIDKGIEIMSTIIGDNPLTSIYNRLTSAIKYLQEKASYINEIMEDKPNSDACETKNNQTFTIVKAAFKLMMSIIRTITQFIIAVIKTFTGAMDLISDGTTVALKVPADGLLPVEGKIKNPKAGIIPSVLNRYFKVAKSVLSNMLEIFEFAKLMKCGNQDPTHLILTKLNSIMNKDKF